MNSSKWGIILLGKRIRMKLYNEIGFKQWYSNHSDLPMDIAIGEYTEFQKIKKICPKCGQGKYRNEFSKNSNKRDGLQYACKDCISISGSKYYYEFSESIKERHKLYQKKYPGIGNAKAAKYEAKKKGCLPDYSEDFNILMMYLKCPVGFQVSHIVPLREGGKHTLSNLHYTLRYYQK